MSAHKFSGPRALSSPEVTAMFRATGSFHDAFLDEAEVHHGNIYFFVAEPYFPAERKCSINGMEKAKFSLTLTRPLAKVQREELNGLSDEDIMHLSLDLASQTLTLSTLTIPEMVINIDIEASSFEWK